MITILNFKKTVSVPDLIGGVLMKRNPKCLRRNRRSGSIRVKIHFASSNTVCAKVNYSLEQTVYDFGSFGMLITKRNHCFIKCKSIREFRLYRETVKKIANYALHLRDEDSKNE
jgi:hypothetical protein